MARITDNRITLDLTEREAAFDVPAVVSAEQCGWDCYVLIYNNGSRQQCSRERYLSALAAVGAA